MLRRIQVVHQAVEVPFPLLRNQIQILPDSRDLLVGVLLFLSALQLLDEVSVFVEIVGDGLVGELLDLFLHWQLFVDD